MVHVAIIGTGDMAYGLSHLFTINNSSSSGNKLEVTKPNLSVEKSAFHETKVPVTDFDDALVRADVLILAIPGSAILSFVATHLPKLKGKILVDVTNDASVDVHLGKEELEYSEIEWVKAFNDIGAVDILLSKVETKTKIPSKMCSTSNQALEIVKSFAEVSLGLDVKLVPPEQFEAMTVHQSSLGTEWINATILIMEVFAVTMVYNIVRHPIEKGYPWRQFPLFVMNKSICWTALWGFAIAQIPGMLARMSNAYYRNNLLDKSKWLRSFLAMRKHLGLLSLWFLSVHIFMSTLMFSIAYYDRFFEDKNDPKSRMTSNGESSFMFGSFAAALYLIMGICSLPSVALHMTKAQWDLVYGPVAWSALAMGTAHVMCQGLAVTWQNGPWTKAGGMPPITLISITFPCAVIAFKVFQMGFVRFFDYRAKQKIDAV